jgi:protein phosphatase
LIKEKTNFGDSFILCSDGLWSELDPLDIRDALLDENIEKSLEQMVGMVLKAGAPDNLTAVIFRVG